MYALAEDSRNDVASNIVALVCGLIGKIYISSIFHSSKYFLFNFSISCSPWTYQTRSNRYRSDWCYCYFCIYYHCLDFTS